MSPQSDLARMISLMHCPECGALGHPTVVKTEISGNVAVKPAYQCDTPGCSYNHFRSNAWTAASST